MKSKLFLNMLVLFLIFNIVTLTKLPEQKKSSAQPGERKSKSIPDDMEAILKSLIDSKSKECLNELLNIYKKDYKQLNSNSNSNLNTNNTLANSTIPYRILPNQEKFLNRTSNQITKKLNKYNFLEGKNFTGIRWVNPKDNKQELKKMLDFHLQHITEYYERNFYNCKNTVPEFVFENYQFFFQKIVEVKKIFQKFNLFKQVRKFSRCMTKYNTNYMTNNFGENILSGRLNIKKLLIILKNVVTALTEITKNGSAETLAKSIKKIVLNTKGLPVL
jgi:hypothetical protein